MGGYNSGRGGGGPTVESAPKIGVYTTLRSGESLSIGQVNSTYWSNHYSGEVTLRMMTIARLDHEEGPHVLFCHLAESGDVVDRYRVWLTSTDQPFGGERWWFRCPHTGCRVAALYLPRGARRFASAGAYKLAYVSQRSTDRDRAIARAHKIRRRLGSDVNPLVMVGKPPRMHWRTFEREIDRLAIAEGAVNVHMLKTLDTLKRRCSRLA